LNQNTFIETIWSEQNYVIKRFCLTHYLKFSSVLFLKKLNFAFEKKKIANEFEYHLMYRSKPK